jgi:argininosuccinate lyase
MSNDRLNREIHELIDHRLERGKPVEITLVLNEIKDRHDDIRGGDALFWVGLAEDTIVDAIKGCMGRFKPKPQSTEEQIVFPGFMHLQKAYPVMRDSRHYLMPVQAMTLTERLERADEYRKMGQGCFEHADELENFDRHDKAAE